MTLERSPNRSTTSPPTSPKRNRVRPNTKNTRPTAARLTSKLRAKLGRIGTTSPYPSATVTEIANSLRNAGLLSGDGAGGSVAWLPECCTWSFSLWKRARPSRSLALDQLDEEAVIRLRVDEGDHVTPSSQPWFLVDHFNALGFERVQCCR